MDRRTRLQSKYRAEEITTTTPHNDGTYNITGEKSKRSTKKKNRRHTATRFRRSSVPRPHRYNPIPPLSPLTSLIDQTELVFFAPFWNNARRRHSHALLQTFFSSITFKLNTNVQTRTGERRRMNFYKRVTTSPPPRRLRTYTHSTIARSVNLLASHSSTSFFDALLPPPPTYAPANSFPIQTFSAHVSTRIVFRFSLRGRTSKKRRRQMRVSVCCDSC